MAAHTYLFANISRGVLKLYRGGASEAPALPQEAKTKPGLSNVKAN